MIKNALAVISCACHVHRDVYVLLDIRQFLARMYVIVRTGTKDFRECMYSSTHTRTHAKRGICITYGTGYETVYKGPTISYETQAVVKKVPTTSH